MPGEPEERKKRSRKRKYKENVTDQPATHVITYVSDMSASISSGYVESTHPQPGPSQSSGLAVAPAPSVVSLPSVTGTTSTASLTHSAAGDTWSFQSTRSSITTGISFQ